MQVWERHTQVSPFITSHDTEGEVIRKSENAEKSENDTVKREDKHYERKGNICKDQHTWKLIYLLIYYFSM